MTSPFPSLRPGRREADNRTQSNPANAPETQARGLRSLGRIHLLFPSAVHTKPKPPRTSSGYSLPEVMISSVLLAAVVASSVRLTSSSILGMNRSKLRNQISTAMSERVETLRLEAFRFLCEQGCSNSELTQEIRYDLAALKPRCTAQDLGGSFLAHLRTLKPSPTEGFTVGETDAPVIPSFSASGNQLRISLDAPSIPMRMSTTLVPMAQGWCP